MKIKVARKSVDSTLFPYKDGRNLGTANRRLSIRVFVHL